MGWLSKSIVLGVFCCFLFMYPKSVAGGKDNTYQNLAHTTRTHIKWLTVKINRNRDTIKEGQKNVYHPHKSKACHQRFSWYRCELDPLKWLKPRFSLTGKKVCLFKACCFQLRCFWSLSFWIFWIFFFRSGHWVVKYKTLWVTAEVKSRETQITRIIWTIRFLLIYNDHTKPR